MGGVGEEGGDESAQDAAVEGLPGGDEGAEDADDVVALLGRLASLNEPALVPDLCNQTPTGQCEGILIESKRFVIKARRVTI